MELIIRHQFRDMGNYYVTTFFNTLYQTLLDSYPQHTFNIVNSPEYEINGYGSVYSCMNFSIINPQNERYILVSFFDNWKYHFMKHLGWKPSKMVRFFYPGGFNYIDYFNNKQKEKNNPDIDCPSNIQTIYRSFFYSPYNIDNNTDISDIYHSRNLQETRCELYFRGYLWDFRQQMVDHIKDESIVIIDKNIKDNTLPYKDYLKDLAQYKCALSLPGGTEVCNRDIECFAIGVPVIRPHLDIQYPDPLISNIHYINCYHNCKYWDGNPSYLDYAEFTKYLEYYWNTIRDNDEYLHFIATNAREWYLRNCSIEHNIKYILSDINLGEL